MSLFSECSCPSDALLKSKSTITVTCFTNLVPRVVLEQPWLSQVIPWFLIGRQFFIPNSSKIVGMQTRSLKFRQLLHRKWNTVKNSLAGTVSFDLWLHNQPWFNHGLFTWITHDSAKICSKLSQIHKARLRHLSAAIACTVQLYSYSSVLNS